MEVIKVKVEGDGKFSFLSLIEKVAKDEIKKLAEEKLPIEKIELIKQSAPPALLNIKVISSSKKVPVETTTLLDQETTAKLSVTTGSMNLDSETIMPTNAPAVESETIKLETVSDDTTETLQNRIKVPEEVETTTNSLQLDENVTKENRNDSLLNAVGDLLSSILGLESKKSDENAAANVENPSVVADNETVDKNVVVKETIASALEPITTTIPLESEASSETSEIERGTEKMDETATPVGFEGERNIEMEMKKTSETMPHSSAGSEEKIMSEIDLKIENLANAQTGLVTEITPELVTVTVREEPSETSDNEPDVLEVISDSSSDSDKPVSFEESVNQIMNLVKNSEGHLKDSVLIDNNMKQEVSDLDQIIYGTLKEVDSDLGMQEEMPMETFEPVISQKVDLIKNYGLEIAQHPFKYDNFVLNSAKAALHYNWQDDVDF